jgi:hypothetical protein
MNQAKKRASVKPPVFMKWGSDDGKVTELTAELEATKETLRQSEAKLAVAQAEHAQCASQIRDLQDKNTSLVQLTVASQLLCGGGEREDVLNAIEEIIINMIGSEEIAIVELLPNEAKVKLTRTRGIDGTSERFAKAVAPIREAITTGRIVLPHGRDVTAVVPLKMDSTTFGAVAVFRLLEQKPSLDNLDHELFDLLSRMGAVAIFSAAFRSMKETVRPPRKEEMP